MQKIISLFQRNYDGDRLVRDEVVPGAEWILAGEGKATRKIDGTCCMVRDGKLFKRYDVKNGKKSPANFEAAQEPDPVTGHWPGWVPVSDSPDDRWHREAWGAMTSAEIIDGTYELIGPKVQGNPEGWKQHALILHGSEVVEAPRTFNELREWFKGRDIEGIVWHHPDGRMAKIKKKDFGMSRKEPK